MDTELLSLGRIARQLDHLIQIAALERKLGVTPWKTYREKHPGTHYKDEREYLEAQDPGKPEHVEKSKPQTEPPEAPHSTSKTDEGFADFTRGVNHGMDQLGAGKIPESELATVRGRWLQFALAQSKKAGFHGPEMLDAALESLHRVAWAEPLSEKSPGERFNKYYVGSTLLPHAYAEFRKANPGASLEKAKKDPKIREFLKYVSPQVAERAWNRAPNKVLKTPGRYRTQTRKTVWDWKPGQGSFASYLTKALYRTASEIRKEGESDEGLSHGLRIQPSKPEEYTKGEIGESEFSQPEEIHPAEKTLQRDRLLDLAAKKDPSGKVRKMLELVMNGTDIASSEEIPDVMKSLGIESRREYLRFRDQTFKPQLLGLLHQIGVSDQDEARRILVSSPKARAVVGKLLSQMPRTKRIDAWVTAII